MTQGTILLTLSSIMAIFGSAGLTATNDLAYLVILVTAIIGVLSGALISDEEAKEAQAREECKTRQLAERFNNLKK